MAGDWIKIEHATPDKPEINAMADLLGIEHDAVFGKCVRLWIWADQQSVDGNAPSVTKTFIDRIVYSIGFADALESVGWLSIKNSILMLPNFARHNGKTAKSRANTAKRVAKQRNGASVTKALPEKRREEKRREEDSNPSNSIKNDAFDATPGFSQFWANTHRKVGKAAARKAFDAAVKRVASERQWERSPAASFIAERMRLFAASAQAQDPIKGQLHPSTWLNEGRYDDDEKVWDTVIQGRQEFANDSEAASARRRETKEYQAGVAEAKRRRERARANLAARTRDEETRRELRGLADGKVEI